MIQFCFAVSETYPGGHKEQMSLVVIVPPLQIALVSIMQVLSQPSPFTRLLSSHSSVACLLASPHFATQRRLVISGEVPPVHTNQVSTVVVDPPLQAE